MNQQTDDQQSAQKDAPVQQVNQENGNQEEAQWKEKYLRAIADYQNLRKRTDEETQEVRMFAGRVVIEKLLPIIDLLERAQEHLKDQGLSLAMKEFHVLLATLGVERIDVLGKPFDPQVMDCIELVPGKEQHIVASVIAPGYRMHGVTIRPAKVAVGAAKEQEIKEAPAE